MLYEVITFQTPGFTYIAVQDIQVVDQMPNGQGYLSSTDPYLTSTSAIQGISLNPAGLAPLDEVFAPDWLNWTFNQIVPAERITEKDHWFRRITSYNVCYTKLLRKSDRPPQGKINASGYGGER